MLSGKQTWSRLSSIVSKVVPWRTSIRCIETLNINNVEEKIYTRDDYPISKCQNILNNELVSVLGYGPQGRGQSLNLRDNGINVCLGLRKNTNKKDSSWNLALKDGWIENKNLFTIEEACYNGTIISYLVSDAAQIELWDTVNSNLFDNNTLYFSHGFGIVFNKQTGIIPTNKNIDIILCAPKGPGSLVRKKYLEGNGINSSFAIHQDYTKNALNKCLSMTFGIGTQYAFETTFENEVYSDLTGERSVLMGMIQGAFKAQYDILREMGHSPSEAYNETVEEALSSLYPLINEKGMDWMYANCSTTAQRGAIDWSHKYYDALKPVIKECYNSVKKGKESEIVINCNKSDDYREKLNNELKEIENQEIWKVGKVLRQLRDGNIDTLKKQN